VRLKQLKLNGGCAGVRVHGDYPIIESCDIQGFHASGFGYDGGGIYVMAPARGALIQNNTIYKASTIAYGDYAWGIFLKGVAGPAIHNFVEHVIKGNTITGAGNCYRDVISGSGDVGNAGYWAGYQAHDAIYNNVVSGWNDDSLEIEGTNVNTLVFGNTSY
jgi:hypothetical protein